MFKNVPTSGSRGPAPGPESRPGTPGAAAFPPCSPASSIPGSGSPAHRIDQAHRQGRLLNEMGQNSQLLGGEVRKIRLCKTHAPGQNSPLPSAPAALVIGLWGLAKACTNPIIGLRRSDSSSSFLRQDALRLPGSCL